MPLAFTSVNKSTAVPSGSVPNAALLIVFLDFSSGVGGALGGGGGGWLQPSSVAASSAPANQRDVDDENSFFMCYPPTLTTKYYPTRLGAAGQGGDIAGESREYLSLIFRLGRTYPC